VYTIKYIVGSAFKYSATGRPGYDHSGQLTMLPAELVDTERRKGMGGGRI